MTDVMRKMAARVAGAHDKTVVLNGPFTPMTDIPGIGDDVYEGTVMGLKVQNDEFNRPLWEKLGWGQEDIAEEGAPGEHTFHVKVLSWYYEPPESHYAGGNEIEDWDLVALDGVALTPEDAAVMKDALNEAVQEHANGWSDESRDFHADF